MRLSLLSKLLVVVLLLAIFAPDLGIDLGDGRRPVTSTGPGRTARRQVEKLTGPLTDRFAEALDCVKSGGQGCSL